MTRNDSGVSRPSRPKKKKKGAWAGALDGVGSTLLYVAFVLGVSLILSSIIIALTNDVFGFVKPDKEAVIELEADDGLREAADKLKENGLIKYPGLFTFYCKLTKFDEERMAEGEVTVSANLDYRAMSRKLYKSSAREEVEVTIPEGYELEQIVDKLVESGVCDEDSLYDTIANYEFAYDFLEEIPYGEKNRLEGYLFPDTYRFYTNDDSVSVIKKFLANFDSKYSDDFAARANQLGMTTQEVITLASIIERESTASDRETISSVFHNRLKSSSYPYLQSCATVEYFLEERKEVISIEDTKIDNLYNTYLYRGLPPGPIASPGLSAIYAALYPADTNYLFFALQEDGTHKFSRTYDEHLSVPNVNPN